MAWLADHDLPSREEHCASVPDAFMRSAMRAMASANDAFIPLLAAERPRRDDEAEEPDVLV